MNYIIDTPCGQIKGVKGNIDGIIAFNVAVELCVFRLNGTASP